MKRWTIFAAAMLMLPAMLAAAAEDQYFDSDGVQIRYIVEGEGEPVVLVHGFSANLDLNFGIPGVIDALAQDYQVIALDCRGHGKSDKPHGAGNYGMKMVNDVIRLMDHLNIDRAHIGGYSMGGFLTMKLIHEYPDRAISAMPGGAGRPMTSEESNGLQEGLAQSLESGNGIGPLLKALTPEGQPEPTPEQLAQINTMLMATNDPIALAGVIRGMQDFALTDEQLEANEVPTLVLVGEIDPLNEQTVGPLNGVMSNVEIIELPGRDHMSAFADPGYVEGMREHISRHSIAATAATD